MTSDNTIETIGKAEAEAASATADDDDPTPWLDLVVEEDRWQEEGDLIRLIPDLTRQALDFTNTALSNHCLTVALVSDTQVQELNKTFLGKDKPTNVLSFPAGTHTGLGERRFLGDVVLAHDTVLREAAMEAKSVRNHAAHLIVHGILHLTGYGHDTDDEAESMEYAEVQILQRFGIPDPYIFALEVS